MTSPHPALLQYVKTHLPRFRRELDELLAIPSVSTDPPARARCWRPPNGRRGRCARWAAAGLRAFPPLGARGLRGEHGGGKLRAHGADLRPLRRAAGGSAGAVAERPLSARGPRRQPVRARRLGHEGADPGRAQGRRGGCSSARRQAAGNIKFLFEGEEEIGSPTCRSSYATHRDLLACDLCLNPDRGMIAPDLPTITYGLRGLAYFELRLRGPDARPALRDVRRRGAQPGPGAVRADRRHARRLRAGHPARLLRRRAPAGPRRAPGARPPAHG